MKQIEPVVPLEPLDPGSSDETYWVRFHGRVKTSVSPYLARRRERVTVGVALLSWSRMTVPLSVTVAAIAVALTFFQVPAEDEMETLAGVEDVLLRPGDGEEPLPAFLRTDEEVDRDLVLFTVEGF